MSYLTAFFIVCLVIVVVAPALFWQIHQAWKAEQAKNCDPYEDTSYTDGPDDQPGTDLALHDECALIYSLPAYGTDDHTTTNPTGD